MAVDTMINRQTKAQSLTYYEIAVHIAITVGLVSVYLNIMCI